MCFDFVWAAGLFIIRCFGIILCLAASSCLRKCGVNMLNEETRIFFHDLNRDHRADVQNTSLSNNTHLITNQIQCRDTRWKTLTKGSVSIACKKKLDWRISDVQIVEKGSKFLYHLPFIEWCRIKVNIISLNSAPSTWPQIKNHIMFKHLTVHIFYNIKLSVRSEMWQVVELRLLNIPVMALVGPLSSMISGYYARLIYTASVDPHPRWPTFTFISPINHLAVQSKGLSVEERSGLDHNGINSPMTIYKNERCPILCI